MRIAKEQLLKNLIKLSEDVSISEYYLTTEIEAANEALNNWTNDINHRANHIINKARKAISEKLPSLNLNDYISKHNYNGKIIMRLKTRSTYDDRDKILSYFYQNISEIDKVLFFSKESGEKNFNETLFGCMIETQSESEVLICDLTSMKASKRRRELEIIKIFRHMAMNGLMEKMFYILKKLNISQDIPVSETYRIIHKELFIKVTPESIRKYITLIKGTNYNIDESEYLDIPNLPTI